MKPAQRDVNAAQRAHMAIELRAKKTPYEQIAVQCGYGSRAACYKAIQRELERVVSEDVDMLRREELLLLDTLHQECWDLATDKKNKGRLFAVDRLLAISERRCKLMGLDKKPEDLIAAQNYTKRIILTHGGQE